MMAWVHASIGAALGSRIKDRRAAFGVGVVSHGVADLIPHRDYDLPVELPLLLAALGAIAWRYGADSPEMVGALGGIAPDIENGLEVIGITKGTVYPTHTRKSWFIGHGRKIKSPLPQVALVAVCIAVMEWTRREP